MAIATLYIADKPLTPEHQMISVGPHKIFIRAVMTECPDPSDEDLINALDAAEPMEDEALLNTYSIPEK